MGTIPGQRLTDRGESIAVAQISAGSIEGNLRRGRPTLPQLSYADPSSDKRVEVAPTTAVGAGGSRVKFLNKGTEIWSREFDFTPWDLAITPEGFCIGYAYSLGLWGYTLAQTQKDSTLIIFGLDPNGVLIAQKRIPRASSGVSHTRPFPQGRAVRIVPSAKCAIVELWNPLAKANFNTWEILSLASNYPVKTASIKPPLVSSTRPPRIFDSSVVVGTPLVLVAWKILLPVDAYADRIPSKGAAWGDVISLCDTDGSCVWKLSFCSSFDSRLVSPFPRPYDLEEFDAGMIGREDSSGTFAVLVTGGASKEIRKLRFSIAKAGTAGWRVDRIQ
jgi:hypothetical protein